MKAAVVIAFLAGLISGFSVAVFLAIALASPTSGVKQPVSVRPVACWRDA